MSKNLSASKAFGIESRAKQFSSILKVFSLGHLLISVAKWLIWLQFRTSSVASSFPTSPGTEVRRLEDKSTMAKCFRFNKDKGKVVN